MSQKFWAPLHEVKFKNLFNRLYQNVSWVFILSGTTPSSGIKSIKHLKVCLTTYRNKVNLSIQKNKIIPN